MRNRDTNKTEDEYVCAICCRPEVAGDVISGENLQTTECYRVKNFEAASICSFQESQNKPCAVGQLEPHFEVKEQKLSNRSQKRRKWLNLVIVEVVSEIFKNINS